MDDRSDETEDQPPATAPRPTRTPTPPPTATPTPDPTETERPTVELRDASDADDEVAIGRPGDGDAMAGLIAGGALAATIAAAGVVQARNRRTRFDP